MHSIRKETIACLVVLAGCLFAWRAFLAVRDMIDGDASRFLAFPLTVILPSLAFGFLATRPSMASSEGALMQLGAMIQLLLIVALPGFALHLALGFPVVFLVVEMFETRFPAQVRVPLKRVFLR